MAVSAKRKSKRLPVRESDGRINSSYERYIFGKLTTKGVFFCCAVVYIVLFLVATLGLPEWFKKFPGEYKKALPALLTLIFWPAIVVCNSRYFHKVYIKISSLFEKRSAAHAWYTSVATNAFTLWGDQTEYIERKRRGWEIVGVIVHFLIVGHTVGVCIPEAIYGYIQSNRTYFILALLAPVVMSLTLLCVVKQYRNLHTIFTVVISGLTYYLYLFRYSDSSIKQATADFLAGGWGCSLFLAIGVVVIFFIAGTTIYPMVHMFIKVFTTKLEDKLAYPIPKISEAIDSLKSIKSYFTHLMGVNLVAYMQLLATVYLAGIFNTTSIVTLILFCVGSAFPAAMYLAANAMFKRLMLKIYTKQVEKIDIALDKLLTSECCPDCNALDKIQTLLATKEMYLEEFEVHIEMNKEVFAAALSPILTVILTILLPGSAG